MKNSNYLQGRISLIQGDITRIACDAIVNAANPSLLGGGGVDGAIHRAAGPKLLDACRAFNGCLPGEARITPGFNLPSRYVIHTPGPVYHDGSRGEAITLSACYRNSMSLARANGCSTVSFPAISTGVYRYPLEEASRIALTTIYEELKKEDLPLQVIFVLYDNENFAVYTRLLSQLSGAGS